jgi:hypothetical protein
MDIAQDLLKFGDTGSTIRAGAEGCAEFRNDRQVVRNRHVE